MGVCKLTGKFCDGGASVCRVFKAGPRLNAMCYHYRERPREPSAGHGEDGLVREARRILA